MKEKRIKILFICLGNICRSPAAEGVMQKMVDNRGLANLFYIDSAGIGGWHVGQLPDKRMRLHGKARGYHFVHHARQFDAESDFKKFDMIITMDEDNYRTIRSMATNDDERVPDPYYGGDSDFELALDLIEDGCENLLDQLTCTN